MPQISIRPLAMAAFAALLFGASTPAAKVLVGPLGPLALAALLYLGAAAGALPALLFPGNRFHATNRANASRLGGAVLAGGIAAPLLLLAGLAAAPASSVALWLNLEFAATALLGWTLFREHLHTRTWLAGALVLLAGLVLASPGGFSLAWPGALVALAAICWGLDNCLTAKIDGFTPVQITFVKGIVAGSVNMTLALAVGARPFALGQVAAALAVGALSYGVSIVLTIASAQQLGAVRSQMVFASSPFWGVAIAWSLLGEPVQWTDLAGAAIILVALAIAYGERHAHWHAHDAVIHVHAHRHDDGHHGHAHAGLLPGQWHTHEHAHPSQAHAHAHQPDLHHRHTHT